MGIQLISVLVWSGFEKSERVDFNSPFSPLVSHHLPDPHSNTNMGHLFC